MASRWSVVLPSSIPGAAGRRTCLRVGDPIQVDRTALLEREIRMVTLIATIRQRSASATKSSTGAKPVPA